MAFEERKSQLIAVTQTEQSDRICKECWNRAVFAHGTAEIFLRRTHKYRRRLRALAFVGIAVPLIIGSIVLSFGPNVSHLPLFLWFAAMVGLFQLVFSAWSLVSNWTEALQYALESTAENFALASTFKEVATQARCPPVDLELQFVEAKAKDDSRRAMDVKQAVTQKELRYGHRAGLRQFRRECEGCHKIPLSMDSTECTVCGRF